MRFLYRDKPKSQLTNASAPEPATQDDPEHQRQQAQAKMVLYCLNDRMRVFGPMMRRVMSQIESEQGLVPEVLAEADADGRLWAESRNDSKGTIILHPAPEPRDRKRQYESERRWQKAKRRW